MKRLNLVSTISLVLLIGVRAQALMPNVDLRDLARFGFADDKPQILALMEKINQSPTSYGLPEGSTYTRTLLKSVGENAVSTVEIQNQTATGADLFLINTQDKQVTLTKVSIDSQGNPLQISKTDLLKNPPIVQIDILNRQLAMFEPKSGFLKFEPAALGSLVHTRLDDESSSFRSLSQPFAHATLSRSKSELSRKEPDYYGGRPFLRIIDEDQSDFGGFTPFGVHYALSDVLQRGFISNGCFRLRDTDLYELANIVFFSRKSGVPFSVVNSTQNGNRHPYPSINSWYNMPEVTTDPSGKAALKTGDHGLYVFDKKNGQPAELLRAGGY